MRRRRPIALVLLVLLVAASVSYTSGYTLDLVDSDGRPQTAYALYTYQGYWLNCSTFLLQMRQFHFAIRR